MRLKGTSKFEWGGFLAFYYYIYTFKYIKISFTSPEKCELHVFSTDNRIWLSGFNIIIVFKMLAQKRYLSVIRGKFFPETF